MLESYPVYDEKLSYPVEEREFEKVIAAVKAVRNRRAEMNVVPSVKTSLFIETASPEIYNASRMFIEKLGYANHVETVSSYEAEGCVTVVTGDARIFIPLSELVDREKELARLAKEKKAVQKDIDFSSNKLNNPGFTSKAPAQQIEKEREKLAAALEKMEKIELSIKAFE